MSIVSIAIEVTICVMITNHVIILVNIDEPVGSMKGRHKITFSLVYVNLNSKVTNRLKRRDNM